MPLTNFLISFYIEFIPSLSFFFGVLYFDFFIGVKILMFFSLTSLIVSYYRDKRIPIFMAINTCFILVSGTLTLYFHNPYYTVIEYTIYNTLFFIGTILGYIHNRPIMKILFYSFYDITERGWHIFSLRWGTLFIIAAIGNEIFWHFGNQEQWIYYRLFMTLVMTFFGFSQFFLSRRERMPTANSWGLRIFENKKNML